MDLFTQSHATFSKDRKHRYTLFRQWNETKPGAMVIGLNPSTADANDDDQTIGFVKRVLNHNNYGSFYMVNLFTMITPYPKDLVRDQDVETVVKIWKEVASRCSTVIFAWGSFKVQGRDKLAIAEFPDAYCFGMNKDKTPRHAMYLKETTKVVKFTI